MSESVQAYLPFPELDISHNASESDVQTHQTTIMSLAAKLSYVNPLFIDSSHIESEKRLVNIRHSWLLQADHHIETGEYGLAVSYMKYVIEDIEHSADHTHLEEARRVLKDCRDQQTRTRALPALHQTVDCPKIS